MNYRNADEERIRKQRELQEQNRQKVAQQKNLENKTYSGKSLDALAKGQYSSLRNNTTNKVPELKPSTKYNNQNVVANQPQKSTRDTRFDNDFDNFFNYRYGDFSGEVDYDPVTDTDVESWRNVKKDIMRKNKWSDKEFEDKFKAYSDERYKKMGDEIIASSVETAKKHPFLGTLQQAILNPGVWLEGAANMVSGLPFVPDKYKAQSADDPMFLSSRQKEAIKQTVKDEHIKSKLGKGAYDIGTGLGDMVMSAGVPVLGAATLGTETASRNQRQALERGVDPSKAALTGLATGVVSGAMNKVGLDKALASNTIKGAMNKEGLENILEDVATLGIDKAINKNKSQLNAMHDYYASQGMDDQSAWTQVIKDTGLDLATSYGTGAAFGGVMSGLNRLPSLLGGRSNTPDIPNDPNNNVPAVTGDATIDNAIKQTADAEAEIQRLSEQIPKVEEPKTKKSKKANKTLTPEEQAELQAELAAEGFDWSNEPTIPNEAPSANTNTHSKDGHLLSNAKIPEYTMKEDVYFNGSDDDIALAESQDKAIVDTFRNIITDPEFNALSFKNGNKEVFVSPATNGNGLRMSYTIDGVPTGHHDYSLDQIDNLSYNLRNEVGNGGEDIKIQRKSDMKVAAESAGKNPSITSKPLDSAKPIKDQLSTEDRASIFGGVIKGKRRQGLKDSIGYAKKFAGDTAEAKKLAKEANALIESYVESGSTDDYITLLKKIEDLDNLARDTRADYTTKKGDVFTYDNYFTDYDEAGNEVPSSLLDQFVGNSALSKSVKAIHDALADATSAATTPSMDSTNISEQAPTTITNTIANEISKKDFKPIVFTTSDEYTHIISKSTRPGEKWQLSSINANGSPSGHSAFTNDADLLSKIQDAEDRGSIVELNPEQNVFNEPTVTINEMLENPDKYTDDDFKRALLAIDSNADVDDADKDILLGALANELEAEPDVGNIQVKMKSAPSTITSTDERYKVGDRVTYVTDDYEGHREAPGVIKEVYPDHVIVDVPGLSDHVYIDNDMMDMLSPSKQNNNVNESAPKNPTITSEPTTSMDPAHELAGRYAAAYQGFDTYDYMDNMFENDSFEESMANDIQNGRDLTGYIDALEEIIDDAPDEGTRAEMQSLIDELTTLNEGRVPTDGQLTPEEVSRLQDIADGKEDIPETGNEVPSVKPTEPTPVPPSNNEVPEVKGKVRSFSKRGSMDDTLPDEVRNVLKKDYYKVARNADTAEKANSLFDENDLVQTRSNLEQLLEKKDPASALLSYKLAGAYVDAKQYDAATDVLRQVSEKLTEAGQFTQAAKLAMVRNDPMAALRMYQRDLDNLNQWGKDKYGKKWEKIKLTDEDKAAFKNIKAGDSDALSSLVDNLNGRFAKQIPSNLWDKIVGATKTSMLLNPRTQVRNGGANLAFLPIRSATDRVSALGQNLIHLINPNVKVTQSLKGGNKAQKNIARQIFDNMRSDILNENKMKDSTKSDILSRRQTFNDDFFATWVNNLTNGGIEKLNKKFGADANKSTMETLQNFTYWLMGDVGDVPFVKKNFVNRLASYMDAQGITNIDDVPDDAIALATQEALKATFKDDNAFTKALQGVKQKTGKFGEVALPFTKTPANLAVRAYDYSPLGIISTIKKAKSGADVSEVIDDLSKNLTGTAMILLGMKLRDKGILSGNYSEDKDEAAAQKRQGMLENAFHIGGKYYTYDWAQPAATPLVLGSVISDAMKASDDQNKEAKDIVNATYKGAIKVGNTIINSSPLQSLSDMLGGDSYSDGPAGSIAEEIIEFPQRFIPSVLGATARVKDPVIRETYSNDGGLTGILKSQIDTAKSKIPELSKTLPASYDTWGQERRRSNTTGEAAFAQYVNPGQFGVDTSIPIDKDIQAIYDKTGNADVFPKYAPRSLDLGNDGTIKLDNKQHSEYQKELGQLSRKFAEGLFANSEFKKLSDDEKAKMLGNAYNFANVMSKEKLFDHVTDSDKKLKEAYKSNGVNGAIKYWIDKSKADELGITYDTYVKKEAEQPGSAAQYAQDKQKLDAINDKYGTNIQMSTLEKYGENGAEQRAQGTIEAKNYGFVDKEGNANVDAYTKAVDMFGNDQKSLRAYSDFHKQGLKKNAQMIPALMNNNQFTDKQKGQVIMAEHGYKYDDLGNTAKGAYDREGEAGVYYFYLLKNLADTQYGDGNGSVKKSEKVALMNSDNPNVTKLSDDMYYYLGNAKW